MSTVPSSARQAFVGKNPLDAEHDGILRNSDGTMDLAGQTRGRLLPQVPTMTWYRGAKPATDRQPPLLVAADGRNQAVYAIGTLLQEAMGAYSPALEAAIEPTFSISRDLGMTFVAVQPPPPAEVVRWWGSAISYASERCSLVCVIGGLAANVSASRLASSSLASTASSRVDCTPDEGKTWDTGPPLPTTVLRGTALQWGMDVLLVGGDRGDASSAGMLRSEVNQTSCRLGNWSVWSQPTPASNRIDPLAASFRSLDAALQEPGTPEEELQHELWTGAGSLLSGQFVVPVFDIWQSSSAPPANTSQLSTATWQRTNDMIPQDYVSFINMEEPKLAVADLRAVDGSAWVVGTGPVPPDIVPQIGLLLTLKRAFMTPNSGSAWAELSHVQYPFATTISRELPVVMRRAVFTRDHANGDVPVVVGFDVTTGQSWRGDVMPCQDDCPAGQWTRGCTRSPFDAVCLMCSGCGNGTYMLSPCRAAGFMGYADTVCVKCSTCSDGYAQAAACNSTHNTVCAPVLAVPPPPQVVSVDVDTMIVAYASAGAVLAAVFLLVLVSEVCCSTTTGNKKKAQARKSNSSGAGAADAGGKRRRWCARCSAMGGRWWPVLTTVAAACCHALLLTVLYATPFLFSAFVIIAVLALLCALANTATLTLVIAVTDWFASSWQRPGASWAVAACALVHPRVFLLPPPAAQIGTNGTAGAASTVATPRKNASEWSTTSHGVSHAAATAATAAAATSPTADTASSVGGNHRIVNGSSAASADHHQVAAVGGNAGGAPPPAMPWASAGVRTGLQASIVCATLLTDIPSLFISVLALGKQLPIHAIPALVAAAVVAILNVTATTAAAGNRAGRLSATAKLMGLRQHQLQDSVDGDDAAVAHDQLRLEVGLGGRYQHSGEQHQQQQLKRLGGEDVRLSPSAASAAAVMAPPPPVARPTIVVRSDAVAAAGADAGYDSSGGSGAIRTAPRGNVDDTNTHANPLHVAAAAASMTSQPPLPQPPVLAPPLSASTAPIPVSLPPPPRLLLPPPPASLPQLPSSSSSAVAPAQAAIPGASPTSSTAAAQQPSLHSVFGIAPSRQPRLMEELVRSCIDQVMLQPGSAAATSTVAGAGGGSGVAALQAAAASYHGHGNRDGGVATTMMSMTLVETSHSGSGSSSAGGLGGGAGGLGSGSGRSTGSEEPGCRSHSDDGGGSGTSFLDPGR